MRGGHARKRNSDRGLWISDCGSGEKTTPWSAVASVGSLLGRFAKGSATPLWIANRLDNHNSQYFFVVEFRAAWSEA
jgi:hypothetical protein